MTLLQATTMDRDNHRNFILSPELRIDRLESMRSIPQVRAGGLFQETSKAGLLGQGCSHLIGVTCKKW